VEDIGTELADGTPKRPDSLEADGGCPSNCAQICGREGHREPTYDEAIEVVDRRCSAVVRVPRPDLHLIARGHESQSQVSGEFLDSANGGRVGAGDESDACHGVRAIVGGT
jgi:hypothetical protein